MNTIEAQVLETWQIHQRILLFTLEAIPVEAMSSTLSKRGGRDISRQFAHLQYVRVARLKPFAKKRGIELIEFNPKLSPSKEELEAGLCGSGDLMEEYIKQAIAHGGKVTNFKRGVVPMIGYYISHETHHRGNIVLTMKICGHKIPDALKYNIWEWNRR